MFRAINGSEKTGKLLLSGILGQGHCVATTLQHSTEELDQRKHLKETYRASRELRVVILIWVIT